MSESDPGSPTAQLPSALVAGKYRLTSLLGRGGMGSVWAGLHTTLGTRVAVKFIDAEHVDSAEARHRFENEARAAAALRSKHVVEVYDHGVMEDGRPFIVMEFLDGEPLDRRLERLGRLTAKDTARIVGMVCRALSKAHAAGIVHRDLKPENVFLVWDDEDGADVAKVVDFGIAKFTDSAGASSSATRTGSVLGTPYYMSPEQARGLRTVDYRSDLWSVGVIAFRCMTGRLPFEGEAVGDVLVKLCTAPIPAPSSFASDLPPGFDAWLVHALGREPESRFQSASELARSLATVCGLTTPLTPNSGEQLALGSLAPHPVAHRSHDVPFAATTPSPALTPGPAQTGAPITQTPAPSGKPAKGTLVVVALAAFAVIGIGLGVAIKGFGKSEAGAASTPEATAAPVATTVSQTQEAKPHVEVAPPATAVASAAPPPSVVPAPTAVEAAPAQVSAGTGTAAHHAVAHGPKPKTPEAGPAPVAAPPKPVNDIGF
ncbi:MAG TPA: serine/threonine-protein kinase [Polyangiaceae bacterium]|nr:serine/threonine-protein kinase [Polyangiaceae bacterium]